MEHARGTELGDVWQDMETDQKTAIVDQKTAICSGVTSGRRNCDTRSYTRCSISRKHEEGTTR